jgi:hypothetical protein
MVPDIRLTARGHIRQFGFILSSVTVYQSCAAAIMPIPRNPKLDQSRLTALKIAERPHKAVITKKAVFESI